MYIQSSQIWDTEDCLGKFHYPVSSEGIFESPFERLRWKTILQKEFIQFSFFVRALFYMLELVLNVHLNFCLLNLINFILQAFPNLRSFKISICRQIRPNFVQSFYFMEVLSLVFNNLTHAATENLNVEFLMFLNLQSYAQDKYSYLKILRLLRKHTKFSYCITFSVTFSYFITFILILHFITVLYQNEQSVFINAYCSSTVTNKFPEEIKHFIIFCFYLF